MPTKIRRRHQVEAGDQDALRTRLIGMSAKARATYDRIAKRYAPPPIMRLSEWADSNIYLPEGQSARASNKWRSWPYMREVMDSITDPEVERVTVMKGTRVGYTKSICAAICASAATDPCGIIVLLPRDDDVKKFSIDDLEPMFEASPQLHGLLKKDRDGRNSLSRKSLLGGGSIKLLAAMSPRNLRGHDAKKLFCDEVDGMDITKEGDPIKLAIKRTDSHADRKIVLGSTPTFEDASIIDKNYKQSDMRVYQTPCPHCGAFFEIMWKHIRWPENRPQDAVCICPHCEKAATETGKELKPILERQKRDMVENGQWVATAPWVINHRGYKIPTMISLIAKATWADLAKEYVQAKKAGPSELQIFANTVEARVWASSVNRVDATGLANKVENFGLDAIPPWVVGISAGIDTQQDRMEAVFLGWPLYGAPAVLGHMVLDGSPLDPESWKNLDNLLKRKWQHPSGWWLGVDAAAVDSGGRDWTQKVYDFCDPRAYRRIYAIKGDEGDRPMWKKGARVKGGSRLAIVGVDQIKNEVLERLAQPIRDDNGGLNPLSLRLSIDLSDDYFEQVTGEVKRVKYIHQRAVYKFEPKSRGQRVEALDCTVYAWAARHCPAFRHVPMQQRAAQMVSPLEPPAAPPVAEDTRPRGVTVAAPAAGPVALRPVQAPPPPARPASNPTGGAGGWADLFNG